MKKSMMPTFIYPRWSKLLGVIIIMIGIIIFLHRMFEYGIVDFAGGSFPVAIGLMIFFFSKEKDFDERTAYLKFKALASAIPVAAVITMVINYIKNFNGYSIETDSWFSISAFEYLSLTLAISIVWFQYLKLNE